MPGSQTPSPMSHIYLISDKLGKPGTPHNYDVLPYNTYTSTNRLVRGERAPTCPPAVRHGVDLAKVHGISSPKRNSAKSDFYFCGRADFWMGEKWRSLKLLRDCDNATTLQSSDAGFGKYKHENITDHLESKEIRNFKGHFSAVDESANKAQDLAKNVSFVKPGDLGTARETKVPNTTGDLKACDLGSPDNSRDLREGEVTLYSQYPPYTETYSVYQAIDKDVVTSQPKRYCKSSIVLLWRKFLQAKQYEAHKECVARSYVFFWSFH